MKQRRLRTLVGILAVASLTSACADRASVSPVGPVGTLPHGADQLVFRIATSGGFVAPQQTLQQMPSFSLYGDGRAITQGAQPELYPGPALPNLVVTSLTPEGVMWIVAAALHAGLGQDRSYTSGNVSDMPTTTFALNVNGDMHITRVYALGALTKDGPPDASRSETDARAALDRFSAEIADLRRALPAGSVGADRPYTPEGLRVFVQRDDGQRDPMLHEPQALWPLPTPLASFGEETSTPGIRCGVVAGADARRVLNAARSANQLTPWKSRGTTYSLTFRVLLPDEHGC